MERLGVLDIVARSSIKAKELEALFIALGWRQLVDLGSRHREQRLILLGWACDVLDRLPRGSNRERLRQLALKLPLAFDKHGSNYALVAR
jgi:hypothetical protein